MITIFTTLRPLRGKFGVIQRNAIVSWSKIRPKVNIVLVGDEYGTASLARRVGAKYIAKVKRNPSGVPYLDSLFNIAHGVSKDEIFAFLNSDIILFNDFVRTINAVARKMKKFVLVGRRIDLEVDEPIDFDNKTEVRNLKKKVRNEGGLHDYHGIDYFVYPRDYWRKIPNFVIGRTSIDNWLIYEAGTISHNVIDSTNAITAIHQNHDYSSILGTPIGFTVRTGVAYRREDERNFRLAKGKFGSLKDVNLVFTKDLRLKKYNRLLDYEKKWLDFKKFILDISAKMR